MLSSLPLLLLYLRGEKSAGKRHATPQQHVTRHHKNISRNSGSALTTIRRRRHHHHHHHHHHHRRRMMHDVTAAPACRAATMNSKACCRRLHFLQGKFSFEKVAECARVSVGGITVVFGRRLLECGRVTEAG